MSLVQEQSRSGVVVSSEALASPSSARSRREAAVEKRETHIQESVTFEGYKIRALDKVHFFQHLALMLDSGLSMMKALETLSGEDSERIVLSRLSQQRAKGEPGVQDVLRLREKSSSRPETQAPKFVRRRNIAQLALILSRNINRGSSLSQAMGRLPDVFSDYQVKTVMTAGEKSGDVVKALYLLADHEEEVRQAYLAAQKALVYPLFVATICSFFFISVPRLFFGFMVVSGQISSGVAYYLIRGSQIVTSAGFIGASLIFALIASVWLRDKDRRATAGRWFWKAASLIPAVSRYREASRARHFGLTFGTLYRSGLTVFESVELAMDSCGDDEFTDLKQGVLQSLIDGVSLAEALDFLPTMVLDFIAIGTESGNLETALDSAEFLLKEELERVRGVALALLEPLMLILVGGMVATLATAVLSAVGSMATF